MLDIIQWLREHWDDVWMIISSVIAIASIITKLTPNPNDDNILALIIKILNALALNPKQGDAEQKALEAEVNERNDDNSRSQLTSELK